VAGNVPVGRTTHNAFKIATVALHELGKKPSVKIYKGSAVSFMGKSPNVTSVHGRDGLGEVPHKLYPPVEKAEVTMEEKSAVEFLKDFDSSLKGRQYDLVCTGPLTNLATALSLSSEPAKLLNMFDKIVIMGGSFNQSGNITPTAEFNFFFDPVAVRILLDIMKKDDKLSKKIIFVPIDITERVQLKVGNKAGEVDEDASISDPIGKWTLCMLQKYFYFHTLSARELKMECADYVCNHYKQDKACDFTTETYNDIRHKIRKANLIGKSGLKQMPRFCYLHDPLAVWCAIDTRNDYLEEVYIKIHTDNDEMRGTVIILDAKDSKPYSQGTRVRYLSPAKVEAECIKNFKKSLVDACGLTLK
jgi:inosine-uridine nucleoside N-ribohydrolase